MAINDALKSSQETRMLMRARSGKQRFPVAQWVEDLEILQSTSIEKHNKHCKRNDRIPWRMSRGSTLVSESIRLRSSSSNNSREQSRSRSSTGSVPSSRPVTGDVRLSEPRPDIEHAQPPPSFTLTTADNNSDSHNAARRGASNGSYFTSSRVVYSSGSDGENLETPPGTVHGDSTPGTSPFGSPFGSPLGTPNVDFAQSGASTPVIGAGPENGILGQRGARDSMMSLASVDTIIKEKQDFNLQKVDPFFTDPNNEYAAKFEKKLADLNGKNSEDQLCIEEFLEKSEKDWFNRYREVKLGKSPLPSPAASVSRFRVQDSGGTDTPPIPGLSVDRSAGQFLLPNDYVPPTGLKRFMLRKIGDWPVYSIFLAVVSHDLPKGSMTGANSVSRVKYWL